MAYNDSQNESPLPTPEGNEKRSASDLLPKFFRTEANRKFLQGTIDQLIQPGVAEKLNGFVGRKTAKAYKSVDNYVGDFTTNRENYQLEPAAVIKDNYDNVTFYKDYNDYIGSLNLFGANVDNHDRLNSQDVYAWDPHVDWDKFTNFREYYWLPNGPISIPVRGQQREITSTYTVTTVTDDDNTAYIFNDGFERNPTLKLYRGQTYRFEIDTPGHPIAFAITRSFTPGSAILTAGSEGLRGNGLFDSALYGNEYDQGDWIILPSSGSVTFADDDNVSTLYPDGIRKLGEEGEEVATVYVEKGIIEFTIPYNSPDRLYYVSKNSIDTSGLFRIYDVEENTFLNVEADILGKKTYQTASGMELSNGMKVNFQGDVEPAKYASNNWYVEGVGSKIVLINEQDLVIPAAYSQNKLVPFDSNEFDTLPFSNASAYAADKDYIVINRASQDRNAWSRYNRWFHRSVLEHSFIQNNLDVNIDEETRAKRPIIEFEAGLRLYDFGTVAKKDVDLIDTYTKDVFSTIEGQIGYNVDGIDFADGMRVLFSADTDSLVNGKIYEVKFVTIGQGQNEKRQIALIETEDTLPLENETVFVTQGLNYAGKTFYYNGSQWHLAQEKTDTNQPPRFFLCCPYGNDYSDTSIFDSSTFSGTKIFSYREGSGNNDAELGFPLTYRNIENSGDIVFDFNLLSDVFTYQSGTDLIEVDTSTAFLRKYKTREDFSYVNAWSTTPVKSKQYVIRQYDATELLTNNFKIDVYDNSGDLNDLKVVVYLNNKIQVQLSDYEIDRINRYAYVRFYNDLNEGDVVVIKTRSKTTKNENGYYEFPHNLERNPLNQDVVEFTFGEVLDHVDSMIEELYLFSGEFPGNSNLRDIGNVSPYGKRFVKHSGPINLPLYHLTSKEFNIIKALRYSRDEYAKFKRVFLETAATLGFDGETRIHVDKILENINKDKIKTQPFYFSDMIAYGDSNRIEYTVLDARTEYYALSSAFSLDNLSEQSVLIYLNGKQLSHGIDYTFDGEGFALISAGQVEGDTLEILEYSTTDGSFVAPTPSKLGLYPAYNPELTIDDTYQTDEPSDSTPYKVYGQVAEGYEYENKRGWFYPLYTTISAAKSAGNNEYITLQFNGLNRSLYMPVADTNVYGGQENNEIDTFPVGVPMVRGHDGSYIRAYLDYRDELLLDFERRIFNNIKVQWSDSVTDIFGFLGGDFRENEFNKTEIDASLLTEFTQWLRLVDNDYSDNYFYNRLNEFTFNYSNAKSPTGNTLSGFWRGVYKYAYDTDRPHSHPWEMLGFTIKPSWWNEVYGPAPYTSDNLILWRDLEQGIVREPNKEIKVLNKFARPGLTTFIPADSKGKLRSPLSSNYAKGFVQRLSTGNFSFGDQAPVETAWRRSSQFPFAVVTSLLLNKPAQTMGLGFDVSRIVNNKANQKVYADSRKQISNNAIVFPNTTQDDARVLTSGFINYIYNLVASDVLSVYKDYQDQLLSLNNQLGFKLGGFTDKQKVNLVLESRTPAANYENSVFVPEENYNVFFNTSSPIDFTVYSGVAIEKIASGYVVRGYNADAPFFEYYEPKTGSKSVTITVGGISEVSSEWETGRRYNEGLVVEYNNVYYRATATFTAGESFDTTNLAKLPELPTIGGKRATFKRNFDTRSIKSIPYGTKFSNSQDLVDFLLGYGKRLEEQGFEFDFVEYGGSVNNWDQAAKEFLFWTTQGWAVGTVITVSPAANRFYFKQDYVVVDNIYDDFYRYSLLNADGQALSKEFGNLLRDQNSFGIEISGTDEGLYSIALPLVQREHVVLLDNTTVFNDVVYSPSTGYRRDRIKVTGYRSDNWNGGLNIPGFVYDDAKVTDWEQWKDYNLGSIVKYKQFYYVAKENVTGSTKFNDNLWYRLSEKPEAQLITNFDYRINQFADFYDLDTDGFDAELQRMAQHLTGYQKRSYLANIINDDVSQYKFYQGMIQDKGTKNALSKMFEKLNTSGEDTLEFYEEWALQVGRYGATENINQVEFNLKQDKMQESPQSIELTTEIPASNFDKIYRILPHEMYDKPSEYNHAPFPTKPIEKEYVRSAGYVNEEDVTFIAGTTNELNDGDVNLLGLGAYIWVTEVQDVPWTVYQHTATNAKVVELRNNDETNDNGTSLVELHLNKWAKDHVSEGDIIGVRSAEDYNLSGLYKIDSLNLEVIKIQVPTSNDIIPFTQQEFILTKLRKVRVADLDEMSDIAQEKLYNDQNIWIDNYNGDWAVLQNSSVFENSQTLTNPTEFDSTLQNFGANIVTTENNNNVFVSAPGDENGKVFYYKRSKETFNLVQDQEIVFDDSGLFTVENSGFAKSIDVSSDGEYLVIGMPTASGVKTRFKGDFDKDTTYNKNDIVKYRESLWKANREVLPQITTQSFSTFDTYIDIATAADADSTTLRLLVAGDPGLKNNITDHLLIRAPKDMYLGTQAGDTINLAWNQRSYAYPTLDNYLPFDGEIPEITINFLQQQHTIVEKIDHVFFIQTYVTLPEVGDIVTTDTGSAEVFYVGTLRDSAVVYLKDTNGVFSVDGHLYISDEDIVGEYTEIDTTNTSDEVAGFWYIETGFSYSNNGTYYDIGRGLVYADVRLQTTPRDLNQYYNIQSTVGDIGEYVQNKNRASYIAQLSFKGDLAPADATDGVEDFVEDNRWVVRVGKSFSDIVEVGDQFEFRVYNLDNRTVDIESAGIAGGYNVTNKSQTIADIWDGYIDFEFSRFDFSGFPFQPQIGDTLVDVQTPRDGLGGLAITSETTSSAEVVWVQRNFNKIRVYVKNITGTWNELNNIGRYEIQRLANEDIRGAGDVDRIIGEVSDSNNDIVVGTDKVGKLLVFEHSTNFRSQTTWDNIPPIVDEEYWFFDENIEQGIGRAANPPYSLNKDYTQIYHLEADEFGTAGPENEGAVAIFRRLVDGKYRFQHLLVSEYQDRFSESPVGRGFGKEVKIKQVNDYYTLFVSSYGDGSKNEPGSIEIFRHGTKPTDAFKGDYKLTAYNKDDIVVYKDGYYKANKDIAAAQNVITDSIYWDNISWRRGKDTNYRGDWDNSYSYEEGNIVKYNNSFYTATTNLAAGAAFIDTNWEEISNYIDYIGYLPNFTGITMYGEDVFEPTTENPESVVIDFSRAYDVSNDSEVIVSTADVVGNDSTQGTKLVIYRQVNDKYLLDQVIDAPNNPNITDWARAVSIKPDGTKIAVSAPLNDSAKVDQGVVYVYTQVNGKFDVDNPQIITPPNNEESEQFGFELSYGSDNLVVSSLNGDQKVPTTFDNSESTFDNQFTNFRNVKLDTGVVYVFEDINDSLIYSEQFRYDSAQTEFGETLHNNGNHVYVGVTSHRTTSNKGIVVDYRKPKFTSAWNVLRESVTPVDVSKIQGAFLYNKRTNEIVSYIDYIDPIQGKIAGVAEEEITYKTPYDPAKYNVGDLSDTAVDSNVYWREEHVGQVWWNINNARFGFPYQGTTTFQKNEWNKLMPSASIDVYEWVESEYLPSQWNQLADSDAGAPLGISGTAIYGDNKYSAKIVYDDISQTFSTLYYYWVQNKRTKETTRKLSAFDIANIIEKPREQGYRYISFLGENKFVLNNFDNLITSDDLVLNIRYAVNDNLNQNVHSQYLLMSDGYDISMPDPDIERKWWDSLIGFDTNNRLVPDTNIPIAKRYGIQNRPRQGMFVNRIEALKQFVERVNLVAKSTLLTDQYNINRLLEKDEQPTANSNHYDLVVDTYSDIEFISTNKIEPVVLTPIILNGRVVRVEIESSGRGYKVAPPVQVFGQGKNAEVELTINNLGQVTDAVITNEGSGYDENTVISARKFTVLVSADETVSGKWARYSWNNTTRQWVRIEIQDYDVSLYWNYVDWYAEGYNQFTNVNFEIAGTYLLSSINDSVGDVIKVANVGSGGWLLLEKIASEDTEDYTINYKTVGRQNGTIEFKDTLYDYSKNTVGFDNRSFDSFFYDNNPSKELRIIFETLKNDIFINDLAVEYNQLFFASLRYILSEQQRVDWMFKTSFINVKHNLGDLEQKVNFENNKLPSYEEYVNEVKPYSTKVREFVSSYTNTDNTNSSVTDFDNPPSYDQLSNKIVTSNAIVLDNVVFGERALATVYPRKHWLDNHGYKVTTIKIDNPGSGYLLPPEVKIVSNVGSGAVAKAYVSYGKVSRIEIISSGNDYIVAPTIIIDSPQDDDGVQASATAIIGDGLVRTPTIRIKFDRTSGVYTFEDLAETETFTGTGGRFKYNLEWPMDLDNKKVKVYVNGIEQLRSAYTYENVVYEPDVDTLDKVFDYGDGETAAGRGKQKVTDGYTYEKGRIIFSTPPALDAEIVVEYYKPLSMLNAEDRIKFAYNPLTGMFGNDLAQLMTGVDYGGVEVKAFEFSGPGGWDTDGWYTDTWDTFDNTYEDEVYIADGSTIAIELSTPLENGIVYNIYKNGIRLDDPNYGTEDQTNENAVTSSITGDGVTTVIDLDSLNIELLDNDVLIVRKITSDGSIIPDINSYDVSLSGGDLQYQTAKGVNPEEIIVDGDGFVTPTTSGGPEELVPGQVLDSVDIKVYTKDSGGTGKVYSQSYIMDSSVTTYDLGVIPGTADSIFVKVDNILLSEDEYTVDWENNTVTILTPQDGVELNIVAQQLSIQSIVDYNTVQSVAGKVDYHTTINYEDGLSIFVTVDGVPTEVIAHNTADEDPSISLLGFRFDSDLGAGKTIRYTVFDNSDIVNYSQISKDSFVADGSTASFTLGNAPFYAEPTQYNIMVKQGNKILNPGYNIQYTIDSISTREYRLEQFQQPAGSLELADVKVYLNGEELESPVQWRLEVANSAVVLGDEIGVPGDLVEIYVVADGDYTVTNNVVTFIDPPSEDEVVEIYQFSNHDILLLERINYDVVTRTTLTNDTLEYVTHNRLLVGEITLRKPAVDAQYVWVSVNGELLTPSVDYYVTDTRSKVRLVKRPTKGDVIDVIHFTESVNVPRFAFRQFKDMLNRTHFKRIDAASTTLAQPLNQYDLRIEVVDGTNLAEPNKGTNMPGIIWVNGERIEYFVKEENTLRQLRRGTLGTGVLDVHPAGSNVVDQDVSKTIPYKDQTLVQNFTADGVTNTFDIDFEVNSVNEIEVFVAGTRLRKAPISVFDPAIALDSPDGDVEQEAEFTVSNGSVVLTTTPVDETRITVVKKTGLLWTSLGETLGEAENSIARFLRAGTSAQPE